MAFFATSHGKGPIDGLGGTIKHRISEYSMANVVTTEDFAKLANNRCPNILIDYVSKSEVKQFIVDNNIRDRRKRNGKDIVTAPTTRSSHTFMKTVKLYSLMFGTHLFVEQDKRRQHLFIEENYASA